MRRVSLIAGLLALVSLLAPVRPAAADPGDVLSVQFEGEITLWTTPCISDHTTGVCANEANWAQPARLWAPVSPNPACGPVCPQPFARLVYWALDDGAGVPDSGAPCTAVTRNGARPCFLKGIGAISLAGLVPGPYCYSAFQGSINHFLISIDGRTWDLSGSTGGMHTWPVMRWTLNDTQGFNTVDAGVGAMTIENPHGNCGLDPADGFAPMTGADVRGSLTWTHALNL